MSLRPTASEIPVNEPRPELGIAKLRRHPQQLQLRALQHQTQRKGVVDVVANIGVENDKLGRARSGLSANSPGHRCEPAARLSESKTVRDFIAMILDRREHILAPDSMVGTLVAVDRSRNAGGIR